MIILFFLSNSRRPFPPMHVSQADGTQGAADDDDDPFHAQKTSERALGCSFRGVCVELLQ